MSGVTNSLLGVARGQERFIAVGKSGAIVSSTDGSTWAAQNSGISNNLTAVVWSAFGWVAVGENGQILTSADGSNWVTQTSGTSARLMGVGNGFGKTYTGAAANSPALYWSTNGASWSYLTNVPLNSQPDLFNGGFAFGNGLLLGVLSRGSFASTSDGFNWTNRRSPFFYCFGLAYARNAFVTVGGNFGDGSGGRTIGSSMDGIAWQTNYSKSAEGRLVSVAYGKHRFVAVGDKGAILVSAPLLWLSEPTLIPGGLQMRINGEAGGIYHILSSTNLSSSTWSQVGIVTNIGDTTEFTVPRPIGTPRAFFRVLAE